MNCLQVSLHGNGGKAEQWQVFVWREPRTPEVCSLGLQELGMHHTCLELELMVARQEAFFDK